MVKTNIRILASILLFSFIVMAGCLPQPQVTSIPVELYTEAAKTVSVQLTQKYLMTPSATLTNTPEPTSTVTSTPEPTPTIPTATATWHFQKAGEVKSPILVYYEVIEDPPISEENAQAGNIIHDDIFKQQIEALYNTGYQGIPLTLLLNAILFGAEIPEKPIVITFDSTSKNIFEIVYPIMSEFNFVGTIFLTANQLNEPDMLSTDQVLELMDHGWRVGSHGTNGYDLTSNYSLLSDEISGSKLALEEQLGIPITLFSYPYGRADDMVFERVARWGYEAAVGLGWYDTSIHGAGNVYYLARFEVNNDDDLQKFFSVLPWKPD